MKTILVTGGCGFIGSNFIRYLFEESNFNGRIINVDALTYAANPENLSGIAERFGQRYVFVKADVSDRMRLASVFDDYAVESVCHFAAESHVDRSIVRPDTFIQTNIIGTFTLLELVREHKKRIRIFHHISTDEVFGSLGPEGFFTEQSPYRPNSPYSASKASSDHLVRAYHATYGIPVTLSNCSNNYGPYQFPEKLIPLVISNCLENKPLPIYGDGRNVRDWLYVRDHCIAIWKIMEHGAVGETYTVGGSSEMQNLALVEIICDIVDEYCPTPNASSRKALITFVKDRPGHDRRYAIDATKIQSELHWSPEESFESGIRKTVSWYLNNQAWVDRIKTGDYQRWITEQYETR